MSVEFATWAEIEKLGYRAIEVEVSPKEASK